MKITTILFTIALLFAVGCGSGNSPVSPTVTPDIDRVIQWVPDGSNYTANQMREWELWYMFETSRGDFYYYPGWLKRLISKYVKNTLVQQSDAVILSHVAIVESKGVDVPNAPPEPHSIYW